jgi:cellulose synthase/poly-beta-1,6-N-acetylglucosamine synthase-like glycosyltransferase
MPTPGRHIFDARQPPFGKAAVPDQGGPPAYRPEEASDTQAAMPVHPPIAYGMTASSPHQKPSVSVIVPSYLSGRALPACLESIRKQDYPIKEILVANDGPSEGLDEACRRYGAALLQSPDRLGKARAVNRAAARATGDVIFLLDADTVLGRGVLSATVPLLREAAAASPRIRALSPRRMARFVEMENDFNHFVQSAAARRGTLVSFRGCSAAIRSDAFRSLGGLPETLADDIDFSAALLRKGLRIAYAPEASAFTREPETLGQLNRQRARWGKGSLRSFLRNRDVYSGHKAIHVLYYLPFLLGFFGAMLSLLSAASSLLLPPLSIPLLWAAAALFLANLAFHLLVTGRAPSRALLLVPYAFLYVPLLSLLYLWGIASGLRDPEPGWSQRDWKPL